jgi:2-(1,2-epoxy-1,2-dihydrophenyl)acetyl-CoA isomerase
MSANHVLAAREGGILTITLNRPEASNALSPDMGASLLKLMTEAREDASLRCVVLRAEGKNFSAGGDILSFQKTLALSGEERRKHFAERIGRAGLMARAFIDFDRPIIVRLNGAVAGIGLALTLVADLVLAAPDAAFVFAHQRMAVPPDGAVSWLLPRIVGLRQAKRLVLTAAKVEAQEALALGLITSLHKHEELDAAVARAAAHFTTAPAEAVRAARRLLNDSLTQDASAQAAAERDAFAHCAGHEDFAEAVNAFLEKRPARFKG